MNRLLVTRLLLLTALLAGSSSAWAHKASDAFIYLDLDQSTIRVDIALRDLALEVPLDRNADQRVSGAELRAARGAITRYLENGLALTSHGGSCACRVNNGAIHPQRRALRSSALPVRLRKRASARIPDLYATV